MFALYQLTVYGRVTIYNTSITRKEVISHFDQVVLKFHGSEIQMEVYFRHLFH